MERSGKYFVSVKEATGTIQGRVSWEKCSLGQVRAAPLAVRDWAPIMARINVRKERFPVQGTF